MATDPYDSDILPMRIPSTQEERTLALLAHLGGIFGGFIVPMVIWLVKKEQSRFLDDQGKEALNFQLTMLIASVVCMVTIIGLLLLPVVMVVNLVFCILGATAANKGEVYRYSLIIRMIK